MIRAYCSIAEDGLTRSSLKWIQLPVDGRGGFFFYYCIARLWRWQLKASVADEWPAKWPALIENRQFVRDLSSCDGRRPGAPLHAAGRFHGLCSPPLTLIFHKSYWSPAPASLQETYDALQTSIENRSRDSMLRNLRAFKVNVRIVVLFPFIIGLLNISVLAITNGYSITFFLF